MCTIGLTSLHVGKIILLARIKQRHIFMHFTKTSLFIRRVSLEGTPINFLVHKYNVSNAFALETLIFLMSFVRYQSIKFNIDAFYWKSKNNFFLKMAYLLNFWYQVSVGSLRKCFPPSWLTYYRNLKLRNSRNLIFLVIKHFWVLTMTCIIND